MTKFKLTNKAVGDLEDIWDYTFEKWSKEQAENYYKMLLLICKEVAKNPKSGKTYLEIEPDLFGIRANRHIIFY